MRSALTIFELSLVGKSRLRGSPDLQNHENDSACRIGPGVAVRPSQRAYPSYEAQRTEEVGLSGNASPDGSAPRGLGAATWSQLFLRIAGSAGVLVIGGYFVELQDTGMPITSVLVGTVTGLVYLTELLLAPPAGALSDGLQGRKSFLLAGPLLAAFAVLLPPLGFLSSALPPMALVVALLALSRLIEGLGSAASVPATLGFLSEGTDQDPLRRGRQMSFYELAASGGVAIGAVLGPLLWSALHLFAFVALSILYLIGAAFVLFGIRDVPEVSR